MIVILNILILLIMPFIMLGLIKKTKAFFAGRKGAPVLQPLYDVLRLMKKETVYAETVSLVFKAAPSINFAAVIFAAMLAPMLGGSAVFNAPYAFIIFCYVLSLGKFISLIGALDAGSSFEGMGASREACFSVIAEPAFFAASASIIALTGITSFENLKHVLESSGVYGLSIIILAVITLFVMLLTECSRVPVDDPETHLELTMIHEVMVLDNSGIDLALINWGAAVKMFLYASLISALIIPSELPLGLSALYFILSVCLTAVLTGIAESSIARLRMTHVYEFIFIMTIAAFLILALAAYKIYGN